MQLPIPCLVHLKEFYPEGVSLFNKMLKKNDIVLPKGICADLTQNDFDVMVSISLGLEPLWENALGKDWKSIMPPERLQALYQKI